MRNLLKILFVCIGILTGFKATGTNFDIDIRVRNDLVAANHHSGSYRRPNYNRSYNDYTNK